MAPTPTPISILDGGLGTLLADTYHCTFDATTPLWSSHLLLSDPATLAAAQAAFATAGADVLLTATYQASFEGLVASGVPARDAPAVFRGAVDIARGAVRDGGGRVALSLGAYGAAMVPSQEYSGEYDEGHRTRGELAAWHARRLEAVVEGGGREGVDFVAFETVPCVEEIWGVRRAVAGGEKGWGEKGFWISCVFPGEGNRLPDGTGVGDVVRAMLSVDGGGDGKDRVGRVPTGVGINCTRVGKVEGLVREFEREIGGLVERGEVEAWPALVLYPDGTMGEVYNTTTQEWEKPADVLEQVVAWDEEVARIVSETRERGCWREIFVGGCCKTTPEHISKLRKRLLG